MTVMLLFDANDKIAGMQTGVSTTISLLSHSLPESIMATYSVVLTFESVDEILWCDQLNETSSVLRLHGTICFSIFYKITDCMKVDFFLEF